jgi:hypothetical protein
VVDSHWHLRVPHDVANPLCPQVLVSVGNNSLCVHIGDILFRRWSTPASRFPCTLREPNAWVGLGVEHAPEPKFHPPPHFQQCERFATTLAQCSAQKWCVFFRSRRSHIKRLPSLGHSLIPATIPKGTILYHGRADPQIPISPDWLSFDFDHAYLFCRETCHVISMQAKRDLRLVYFDGLSAAKYKNGTMDSQDVILWGKPQPDKYLSEGERIESLCDWGRPLGLDGFIRMEFNLWVHATELLNVLFSSKMLNSS